MEGLLAPRQRPAFRTQRTRHNVTYWFLGLIGVLQVSRLFWLVIKRFISVSHTRGSAIALLARSSCLSTFISRLPKRNTPPVLQVRSSGGLCLLAERQSTPPDPRAYKAKRQTFCQLSVFALTAWTLMYPTRGRKEGERRVPEDNAAFPAGN